jgi:hypothetical protein
MTAVSHDWNENRDLQSVQCQTAAILNQSIERVQREKTELSAEIDAFEQFAERLDRIEPAPIQCEPMGLDLANSEQKPIRRVQEAYRETILSTPHFQREYDESFLVNLRAELGRGLASALHPEHPAPLTPVLKQTLANAVDQCITTRRTLLETLQRELTSLRCSRDDLSEFFDSLDSVQQPQEIGRKQFSQLEAIAASRQKVIHQTASQRHSDNEHHFHEYLYAEKPWDFPVLSAIGRLRAAS